MENAEIAEVFRKIADMLEARKDNVFKIRAYRKAAESIEALNEPLKNFVRADRLREVPGVGTAIAKKISELVSTGKLGFYDRLKTEASGDNTPKPDSKGEKAR
ncbi:MAG: hypothetical protein C4555_01330 [Dehalococcoidia bacterium]|nr:MAG: hypothetical protein C4555_01330 [Dehalococcoidia bacterium]